MNIKKQLLGTYVTIYRDIKKPDGAINGKIYDGIYSRRLRFRIPCFEYFVLTENGEEKLIGKDEVYKKVNGKHEFVFTY